MFVYFYHAHCLCDDSLCIEILYLWTLTFNRDRQYLYLIIKYFWLNEAIVVAIDVTSSFKPELWYNSAMFHQVSEQYRVIMECSLNSVLGAAWGLLLSCQANVLTLILVCQKLFWCALHGFCHSTHWLLWQDYYVEYYISPIKGTISQTPYYYSILNT